VEKSLAEEARSLVASARALVGELAEEGTDWIGTDAAGPAITPQRSEPATPEAAQRAGKAEGRAASGTRAEIDRTGERSSHEQLGLTGGERLWGDTPTLEEVRNALGDCTRCGLSKGRAQIVFGDGNPEADLMFIGEGPGAEEDRRGLPFVGRAGELLTQMIEKGLGVPRSSVYICNIVKCRPPQNRTPLADEASTCRPFLDGQISAVRPRVIVALGKPAASLLLGRDVAITRVRGTWHEYRGVPLMPTFHPAFILRQYTPQNRRLVWEDLKAALDRTRT
jgi:DNA polymerase